MRFHKNVLPIVRDALRSDEISRGLEACYWTSDGVSDREEWNKGWNDDNKCWSDPLILSKAYELGLVNLVGEAEYRLSQLEEVFEEQKGVRLDSYFYKEKRRIKKFLKKWKRWDFNYPHPRFAR